MGFEGRRRRAFIVIAWTAWIALIVAVSGLVLRNPDARSVLSYYRGPALSWWIGEDIYPPGIHGFPYLPISAILFSPFALIGSPIGDLLWRWMSFALLTGSLRRLTRLSPTRDSAALVALVLLASIPGAAGAIRNGQSTVPMMACMIVGAVHIAERRSWPAALALAAGVAFKPWALVLVALAGALHRELRLPLGAALLVVLLAPFLHPDPSFVAEQYVAALHKIWIAGTPGPERWSDVAMMLMRFGIDVPGDVMTAMRLAAAVAILGLGWLASRRFDAACGAILLLSLATCYLLAFNPRAESNTYVMLAPLIALFAGLAIEAGDRRMGAGMLLLCVALGSQGYGNVVFHATELWLKPLVCLLFLGLLVSFILRSKLPRPPSVDPA